LASRELVADFRALGRVPGGLDQQPSDVAVAGFGDRSAALRFAGGVLGRYQPDERHQLLGGLESCEVADLADDPERGQRVDATQASQLRDQSGPRSVRGGVIERSLELLDPVIDEIDRVQIVAERLFWVANGDRWSASHLCRVTPHDFPGNARP
jgi:hypothetical protein